jgi:hypothetical protein
MRVTRMIWYAGTVLTALALLAASVTAAAQPQPRAFHARTGATAGDSTLTERRRAADVKRFRGVAATLNTTPEALENAFEHARRANPKLSRGNFVAANVLANDLGPSHPNITTPAILSGLQNGKSVGQTLQNLGLSASEARQARQDDDREVKQAERDVKVADKDAEKRARTEGKAAKHKSKRVAHEQGPDNQ